jgi:hypothetical protein
MMSEREKNTPEPLFWKNSGQGGESPWARLIPEPAATPAATPFPECEHYEFEPEPQPIWVKWLI